LFTELTGLSRLTSGIAAAAIIPRVELRQWVDLLSTCALAPIGEELCYRGVLMNRLEWLPKWAVVLIGATVFALLHMNPTLILNAFPFGILMGVLYLKFRSITAVIAGHAMNNLLVGILNYLNFYSNAPPLIRLLFQLIISVVTVCCAYLLVRMPKAKRAEDAAP
jgi:membrane protease YdiL (CAAX protease family)